MSLENYLRKLEAIPLSCEQLLKMSKQVYFNGKQPRLKCLLYDDIPPNTNIDIFMADLDAIIILYQIKSKTGNSIGHFITIIKHHAGRYSHFDSYGINVDEELHITHANKTIIKTLLAGVEYDTNKKKVQEYRSDVNTCGLHCLSRSLFFQMNNSEYINYIKSLAKKIKPDDIVTLMFRFLLKE